MAKAKRRKAKATRKTRRRPRRTRRAPQAATMSQPSSMMDAVGGLQKYREELLAQRESIDDQLQKVDDALSAMQAAPAPASTGGTGPRGGRRATGGRYRSGSLKSYIEQVLSGRGVMSVQDITAGVRKAGYKTRNKTLAKSVGIALTEMPNVTKVGRGKFKLK